MTRRAGRSTVEVLAKAMGEKGTIAILAGNQSAPNLQNRVAGCQGGAGEVSQHEAEQSRGFLPCGDP